MKKKSAWILLGVGAAIAWWLWPDSAAEEELGDHLESICDIARSNVDDPKDGVEELFGYYGRNSPEILRLFGSLLVSIERIEDDAEHDERAAEAAEVLHATMADCDDDWDAFLAAVSADPEANELMLRGFARLGRTATILLGLNEDELLNQLTSDVFELIDLDE